MPPCVFKRGRRYYIRLHIPSDLVARFARREIWKALQTECPHSAALLAKRLVTVAERFFCRLRTNMFIDDDINESIIAALEEEVQMHLAFQDVVRYSELAHDTETKNIESLQAYLELQQELLENREYDLQEGVMDGIIKKWDLKIDKYTPEYSHLGRLYIITRIKATKIEIERCKGNFDNAYDDLALPDLSHPRLGSLKKRAKQLAPAPLAPPAPVVPEKTSPRLAEVIDLYLLDLDGIKEKTRDDYSGRKKFVLKLLKNKPVHEYTRQDFIEAREILKVFPKNANSKPELKSVPIHIILKSKEDLGPPISVTTRNKYLTFIASVFKFAHKDAGLIDRNLTLSPKKPKKSATKTGWIAWEKEDLILFLQSSYYKNLKTRPKKPHNYWVPLIALYSGLRLEECCQLYVSDIVKIDDIWCFDVNNDLDKEIKTESSARQVPIHSKLIELGFLEYVKQCTADRLWPALVRGKNGYCHNYGKSFGKFKKRLEISHEKKVFHSFRVNFAESIKSHGHKDEIAGDLLGHLRENEVTAGYTGQTPTQFRKEIIELIDHGFDPLEHITPWHSS